MPGARTPRASLNSKASTSTITPHGRTIAERLTRPYGKTNLLIARPDSTLEEIHRALRSDYFRYHKNDADRKTGFELFWAHVARKLCSPDLSHLEQGGERRHNPPFTW